MWLLGLNNKQHWQHRDLCSPECRMPSIATLEEVCHTVLCQASIAIRSIKRDRTVFRKVFRKVFIWILGTPRQCYLQLSNVVPWCVGGTVSDRESVSGIVGVKRQMNWSMDCEVEWSAVNGLHSHRSKLTIHTARPWTLMVFSPDMAKPEHFAEPM